MGDSEVPPAGFEPAISCVKGRGWYSNPRRCRQFEAVADETRPRPWRSSTPARRRTQARRNPQLGTLTTSATRRSVRRRHSHGLHSTQSCTQASGLRRRVTAGEPLVEPFAVVLVNCDHDSGSAKGRGNCVIERVPAYPANTPRRDAGLDARIATGSTPAGGDAGSASSPTHCRRRRQTPSRTSGSTPLPETTLPFLQSEQKPGDRPVVLLLVVQSAMAC